MYTTRSEQAGFGGRIIIFEHREPHKPHDRLVDKADDNGDYDYNATLGSQGYYVDAKEESRHSHFFSLIVVTSKSSPDLV